MKKLMILALAGLLMAGCGCVTMNAEYSARLDKWCVLSEADAKRAIDGQFDPNDMRAALIDQACAFRQFQDARDGKESAPVK
jgi:hypothetical protein